jgi:hypothetical protein
MDLSGDFAEEDLIRAEMMGCLRIPSGGVGTW